MGRWYLRQIETGEPERELFGVASVTGTREDGAIRETAAVVIYEHPELPMLRALVEAARARLAELEAAYTIEKAKVDGLQARLFSRLRPLHQERERLRLIVSYRRQFLDTLLRQGATEAGQVEREYHEARVRSDREYEETAAAVAAKKELSAEEGELRTLQPGSVNPATTRFAHEPDKLETYHRLTAAINHAKDNGDIETLRQIASDPDGFILRQGWASLDFRDEQQVAQLRKLWKSLELEIVRVIEAMNRLRESPEFELHELIAKNPEIFERVIERQTAQLEREIGELKNEAERLGNEIEELTGRPAPARGLDQSAWLNSEHFATLQPSRTRYRMSNRWTRR